MSEQIVAAALAARLSEVGLPTQYENAPFTPQSGVLYLAESFLPSRVAVGLSQTDAITGVYQVAVMAPRDGTKGPAYTAVQQVIAKFVRGLRLQRSGVTVTIMQSMQGPTMPQGDRWMVPVSVEFRAYV